MKIKSQNTLIIFILIKHIRFALSTYTTNMKTELRQKISIVEYSLLLRANYNLIYQ